MDFQVEQKQWIENNPLRRYRKENKLAVVNIAPTLEVSTNTIQAWEMGAKQPAPENLERIGKLIGDRQIDSTWESWRDERPAL